MRKFILLFVSVLILLPAAAQKAPAPAAAKSPLVGSNGGLDAGFDAWVAETMKAWSVPGMALAVVQDGKVILSKGYGFRDVKKNLPATPTTRFAIGSASKGFTAICLGVLVDQGKLDWDKPVREYLPNFRMYDPFATERMTPRDLVTHRSGLPRHDLLWYNSAFTRKEMFERLRYLEPSKDFRTTFQYQNLMFMTAGYLAGEVAGTAWEDFVRRNLFLPLEMKSSNFSVEDSKKSADFALPYRKVKEEVLEIPFRNIDQVGPAGSINSNVEDMTNYLRMQINKGKHGRTQVLSENNVNQMQSPQMVIPGPLRYTELGHQSYGMGWFITAYRGHKLVHHSGGIDGFSALVTFMPQDRLGMVILTNLNGTPLPSVVSYNAYDRLLGLDQVAWTSRFKDDEKKQRESEEGAKKKGFTTRQAGTRPSHELKEYAGDYQHPGYGVVNVELPGDDLKITFNRISGPLQNFHYDIFEVPEDPLNPLQKTKVSFLTNVRGEIDGLSVALEPNVKEIVFTRMPARAMTERSFLEPLTGEYQLGPSTITISVQGDHTLVLSIAGQPPRELTPARGLSFDLKGITGYSVEFKKDASGKVTELAIFQPNGTFVARRK